MVCWWSVGCGLVVCLGCCLGQCLDMFLFVWWSSWQYVCRVVWDEALCDYWGLRCGFVVVIIIECTLRWWVGFWHSVFCVTLGVGRLWGSFGVITTGCWWCFLFGTKQKNLTCKSKHQTQVHTIHSHYLTTMVPYPTRNIHNATNTTRTPIHHTHPNS